MTDTTALIERFNWLRDSGVCSPTTRAILDDAESALASVRTENENLRTTVEADIEYIDRADRRVTELEARLRADIDLMNIAGIDGPGAEKALAAHDATVRAEAIRSIIGRARCCDGPGCGHVQKWLSEEADAALSTDSKDGN